MKVTRTEKTNRILTEKIDYWTSSLEICGLWELANINPALASKKELSPTTHYKKRYELKCGGYFSVGATRQQGNLLELGGRALDELRATMPAFNVETNLLTMLMMLPIRNVTRIDYAIDCHNFGHMKHLFDKVTKRDFWQKSKKMPLAIHPVSEWEASTIYFPRFAVERFVRCYDKAFDLGLTDRRITRIELQTRSKYAKMFYEDIQKFGISDAGKNHIKKVVDFPKLAWWRYALESEKCDLKTMTKPKSDWQKWIKDVVGKSIESPNRTQEDKEFVINWLYATYNKVIEDLEE